MDFIMDVLNVVEMRCIWIVIDHIGSSVDGSARNADIIAFLSHLNQLASDSDEAVKVLVTARLVGKQSSSAVLEKGILASHHPIVRVPRMLFQQST